MGKSEGAKQAGDQAAHFAWGAATGALPAVGVWGLGGWGLLAGVVLACGSCLAWTLREGKQREGKLQPDGSYRGTGSHVWWDPYLDSVVFYAAVAAGVSLAYALLLRG